MGKTALRRAAAGARARASCAVILTLSIAGVLGWGCKSKGRDSAARPPRAPASPRIASPADLPGMADLRQAHRAALGALRSGRKAAATRWLGRVRQVLTALEQEARRACRLVAPPPGAPESREAAAPCRALAGLSAINDELAERLDPGGPLAEQLDVLTRLRRLLASRLGVVGFPPGPFERPGPVVAAAPLLAMPWSAGPRRAMDRRCWASGPRVLDDQAAGSLALGWVAGAPIALWRSEGDHRLATGSAWRLAWLDRPPRGRSSNTPRKGRVRGPSAQGLSPRGASSPGQPAPGQRAAGASASGRSAPGQPAPGQWSPGASASGRSAPGQPGRQASAKVGAEQGLSALPGVDRGAPLSILDTGTGALVVASRDGDPWAFWLDAQGRPRAHSSPSPILVRGAGFEPGRGAALPRPAWLSREGGGRALDLRLFAQADLRPVGRTRLLGARADPGAGLFGTASILGVRGAPGLSAGFWVAFSTLDALHVVRLDGEGRPQGLMRQIRWPVPGGVVTRCTFLAADARSVFALAIAEPSGGLPGRAGARRAQGPGHVAPASARLGLLAVFSRAGAPARLPVVVSLPPGLGCPGRLRVVSGRLVLVGTIRGPGGRREPGIGWVELTSAGQASAVARISRGLATLGGALVAGDRLFVAYRRQPGAAMAGGPPVPSAAGRPAPGSPGARRGAALRQIRCSVGGRK